MKHKQNHVFTEVRTGWGWSILNSREADLSLSGRKKRKKEKKKEPELRHCLNSQNSDSKYN